MSANCEPLKERDFRPVLPTLNGGPQGRFNDCCFLKKIPPFTFFFFTRNRIIHYPFKRARVHTHTRPRAHIHIHTHTVINDRSVCNFLYTSFFYLQMGACPFLSNFKVFFFFNLK